MDSQVVSPGDDKTTGPVQEAVSGLFLSVACVLVGLRFYVRARIMKKLWWDDFVLLLGLVRTPVTIALQWANCTELCCIASLGIFYASVRSGNGRHVYYLSPEQTHFALEMTALSILFMIVSLMFTKLSICLLLMLVFMTNRVWNYRVWKRAMYIIMALIVATNLSSIILVCSQCKPVARMWNPTMSGTCWLREPRLGFYYYQGGKTAKKYTLFRHTYS